MRAGFVSLIGRPNAGKSTLLNRLVGTKLAIVSDKPQTTRTRILGVRNYRADGAVSAAQVVYIDTPGIHRPLHRMNVRMVDAATDTIREVDLLGLVVDATAAHGHGQDYTTDLVRDAKVPVILILNKIDLMKRPRLLPIIDQWSKRATFAEIVPVSAATGENVDRLENVILDRMAEGEPLYPPDFLTDQPERRLAGELVREKLLQFTRAEIPFASAVMVDRFDDEEKGLLKVFCTIVVDRESQKPIVLGRGGSMIKRIGSAAREDLERFFATRVFLDLRVRVRAEWREDDRVLNDMGL